MMDDGTARSGRRTKAQHTLMLVEEWVPKPRQLTQQQRDKIETWCVWARRSGIPEAIIRRHEQYEPEQARLRTIETARDEQRVPLTNERQAIMNRRQAAKRKAERIKPLVRIRLQKA